MHSCLYEGRVRHRRFAPRQHQFEYRLFYAYLDLDELDKAFARRWLWSSTKPALAWFRRSDYLGDKHVPLKQAVMDRVEQATGQCPRGPIRLLTHLRYFGFVFNPVSFYYCFDQLDTRVETIVAEITNTPWGERHAYVLPIDGDQPSQRHMHFNLQKDFHVSPFLPMTMDYHWTFTAPEERLKVHMINRQSDKLMFDATLTLSRKPLSAANCAGVLARYPLMTMKVIGAIYWQALRLFLKRTPFYNHPAKLDTSNEDDTKSVKSL